MSSGSSAMLEGNVFLQDGAVTAPCRQTLAKHHGVVSQSRDGLNVLPFRHGHILFSNQPIVKRGWRCTLSFAGSNITSLSIWTRRCNGVGRPNAHALLSARVHVTCILDGHLGVGSVE